MKSVELTAEHLESLYAHNILLRYNSGPPDGGRYGWLQAGAALSLRQSVAIEENVGLYGGPYKPFVGGRKSHGLASVGSFSYSFSALPEGLTVGRYCSISSGLKFLDSAHPLDAFTTSAALFRPNNALFQGLLTSEVRSYGGTFSPIPRSYPVIGHDVWIGANVTLAPHVHIGTGAVIAAGATVTRNVEPYSIVGGNPARHIRLRFSNETVQALLESQWWDFMPNQVFGADPRDLPAFIRHVSDGLDKYQPRVFHLTA